MNKRKATKPSMKIPVEHWIDLHNHFYQVQEIEQMGMRTTPYCLATVIKDYTDDVVYHVRDGDVIKEGDSFYVKQSALSPWRMVSGRVVQ